MAAGGLDAPLTAAEQQRVRREAARLLQEAGATHRFPAPVDDLVAAAKLSVARESLDVNFLQAAYGQMTSGIRKALQKVRGFFNARSGEVFLDHSLKKAQLPWIKLHETGHGYLPWQRPMYSFVEDCDHSLDKDVADKFEAEAHLFAGECLFKGDTFTLEAQDHDLKILTPVKLAKKYGASIYSSVRRYVITNPRACAVVVYNKPELVPELGFQATLRRAVASPGFLEQFGSPQWPAVLRPADETLGALLPVRPKQRMSRPREFEIVDRNGTTQIVVGESFTNTHQVFILLGTGRGPQDHRPAAVGLGAVK